MRILLDEQLPRGLARHLGGHYVRTVQQSGWAGIKNGALLMRAVAAGFEVFVTADRSLRHQQNLSQSVISVIVLYGESNALEDLLPLVPRLLAAIGDSRPGEVSQVGPAEL